MKAILRSIELTASLLVASAGLAASSAQAQVEPPAGMLRWPAVGKTDIVFSYANDLWLVPRTGGQARPLANPAGQESFPRFSPDGSTIAFIGAYEGGRDIYTIPAAGAGSAQRVTHHPAGETLCGWTKDGKLLFMSNGLAGLARQTQLFTVDAKGGLPTQLPVPYGGFGSISPDGRFLAYTLHSTDNRTWKRYRGGMATDLWLFDLQEKKSRRITDWEGTDTLPMFNPAGDGSKVYYLSDQGPEHRLNIWEFDTASGGRKQITAHATDDVRWPSVGPGPAGKGEIVFQLGSELRLLDLGTGKDSVVKVTIPGDRPTLRPRIYDAARYIEGSSISPTGKRVAIEARGELWTAPAKEGVVRQLTRTPGIFEREPAWSPDGKWIAYFSDESGEIELWVRASDARPAEKDDAEKKDEKKDEKPAEATKKEEPKEPRKLTSVGAGFKSNIAWSPDSKHLTFRDNFGNLYLTSLEDGKTVKIDKDPWDDRVSVSWSGDSNWIAYDRGDDALNAKSVWLYNVKSAQKTRVTSAAFPASAPAFDSKGEYLYFSSNRTISGPTYSDIDTTYIYSGTENILMTPLRADVKSPFAAKADEETLKDDKKDEKKPAEKKDEKKDEKKEEAKAADDPISGTWTGSGTPRGENPIPVAFTLNLKFESGKVTGTVVAPVGQGNITSGTFDPATGELVLTVAIGPQSATMSGKVKGDEISGQWTMGEISGTWSAKRSAKGGDKADDKKDEKKDEKKEVKIDLEGLEARAVILPIQPGSFGRLVTNDDGKLIFSRFGSRPGGPEGGIKIFDVKDDAKEEKLVTAGGGFDLSADRKKLLVSRGGSTMVIVDAAAGGGKSTTVPVTGMRATIPDPRVEWRQIITDVYRVQRDYFYEPTMHGVEWDKVRDHYLKLVEDCVTREDVNYLIAEMISELNIGHAYLQGPGDVESAPAGAGVGMLGVDFELVKGDKGGAYRIARVIEGGAWDADARGPLPQTGPAKDRVQAGDFILAVNGEPVDASKDPWAAFIGTAGRPTTLTVGKNPVMDSTVREVLVKPDGGEGGVRYRAWIERNRKYVEEKSGGKIGYIYVPNTGVDGQSDLYRQFISQRGKAALLIDERWNGGGQIPTRFIELLNRPAVSYWARRDFNDWTWPPDGHNGPKAMLINGLAGSGGDMFPWLFRLNNIGKLIGTRTWGGLVGISGNAGLIDGGYVTVPTFGIYERDGTWAVEGHGVDPDIEVIDDPALMQNGGDPQLDAAIQHLLKELEKNPYVKPARPTSPNRKGMGIAPQDK